MTQCLQPCVSWEAVIARAHVLAAEVKRVKSEVHTTTPGLKAAEARARAWPARDVTHLQFEIAEAPRDGFAALACTAKLALEDALAKVDAAKVHVKHVVDGRRKCHLRGCATLESDAAKFLTVRALQGRALLLAGVPGGRLAARAPQADVRAVSPFR